MPSMRTRGGLSVGAMVRRGLALIWSTYRAHRQMHQTRLHLLDLTDDQLRDIGISREAAEREALRSTINRYIHGLR